MPSKLKPVTAADLYNMRQLHTCELSPDGAWLATHVVAVNRKENKTYSNIWVARTNGREVRQFTQGEHTDVFPTFSPDGKLLAFLSTRSGSMQLHIMHTGGGESWQLTSDAGNVSSFDWAPDGNSLVYSLTPKDEADKKKDPKDKKAPLVRHLENLYYKTQAGGFFPKAKRELRSISIKGGKSRLVFKDAFHNDSPVLTPDGKQVVFTSNKNDDHEQHPWKTDLWVARVDGKGSAKKLETFAGPAHGPLSVSPDGKSLAFIGQPKDGLAWAEQYAELFVVPLKGGKVCSLSARLDRPVGQQGINDTWGHGFLKLTWSPDSKELYGQVTTDGNVELYRFDALAGGGTPLFAEPGAVLDYGIDFTKDKLYTAFSDIENPGDLFARNLDGGKLKQLTRFNSQWLNRRDQCATDEFWCKGGDGNPVQGWVTLPPGFSPKKKYPAILYIHGGPHVAYVRAFFHEFQYLASQGYVVLYCNPRGSDGYGLKHLSAITPGWGDKDYMDLMKFTDACLRRYPAIDRTRLGVTGGSYGGYMTNWIIGQTQRFKAAVTQRSVSNFLSFMGSSDIGFLFHQVFRNGTKTPWEDPKRYLAMSPMTHLVKAKTPTLVIHSENDMRTPVEQGEQVYAQLKLQGVETEFVRFPEESHELSRSGRTDRRIERLTRITAWFDRYLKAPKPAKGGKRKK